MVPMKLSIVLYSSDAETIWNAFRLAILASKKKDIVKIFLLAKGVEAKDLDTDKFKITQLMREFVDEGGEILACGTCLKLREVESSELCPMSTLEDLYSLVCNSDKVISF